MADPKGNLVVPVAFNPSGDIVALETDADGKLLVSRGSGMVIEQISHFATANVDTGIALIPYDDSVPQITEGDQYMTLNHTPTNINNILYIDGLAWLTNTVVNNMAAALFKVGTNDALAAGYARNAISVPIAVPFAHKMTAGVTTQISFTVRCGGSLAGTTTLNGAAGARRYGGVFWSSLRIIEVSAL